jgi:type III pantothenate kinase
MMGSESRVGVEGRSRGSESPAAGLLALDAGNTRIKWGLHDGRGWTATGAIATGDSARIGAAWSSLGTIDGATASNVAGADVARELAAACTARGVSLRIITSQAEQLGVVNGYRDPGQLGADRWAALIAAHASGGGNKLVVNVGTALTVDALAADGRFVGGIIVPGPALMRRSLDRGTAGLRLTDGTFARFPATTPDAITSGALQACVGAIGRMAEAMAARGSAPTRVILSGGAAGEIANLLPMPHAIHENLVLDGLVLIARAS